MYTTKYGLYIWFLVLRFEHRCKKLDISKLHKFIYKSFFKKSCIFQIETNENSFLNFFQMSTHI